MQELSNWGHVVLIWTLVSVLYTVLGLRTWALRTTNYSMLSPRGISTIFITLTVLLTTVVCAMVTWSLVGPLSGLPKEVIAMIYTPDMATSGVHHSTDTIIGMETVFKVNFASMMLFYLVLWLAKASFVVIYIGCSSELTRQTRILLYAVIAAIASTFVFVTCLYTLWCLPVSKNWAFTELVIPHTCRASLSPSVIISTINALVDILIMAAGFFIIRSLKLGNNNFRSAYLIIAIGILTVTVAICRMVILVVRIIDQHNLYNSQDTGFVVNVGVYLPVRESVVGYTEIEAILACIAACLPGVRVLFRKQARNSARAGLTFKDCGSSGTLTPPASPPAYEKSVQAEDMV